MGVDTLTARKVHAVNVSFAFNARTLPTFTNHYPHPNLIYSRSISHILGYARISLLWAVFFSYFPGRFFQLFVRKKAFQMLRIS